MRRFKLVRAVDHSGVSGTGHIVDGVEFSNGQVVIHWLGELGSIAIYESVEVLIRVRGRS